MHNPDARELTSSMFALRRMFSLVCEAARLHFMGIGMVTSSCCKHLHEASTYWLCDDTFRILLRATILDANLVYHPSRLSRRCCVEVGCGVLRLVGAERVAQDVERIPLIASAANMYSAVLRQP
jgi:hypothetical protein